MKQQVLFKIDEGLRQHPFGRETVFEPQRGITKIELEKGYTQVTLFVGDGEMDVYDLIHFLYLNNVPFRYPKLLSQAISFIVAEETEESWSELSREVITGLSLMKIHAANLRDEEGLVAHILEIATRQGLELKHITDVYNCLTLVLNEEEAKELCLVLLEERS